MKPEDFMKGMSEEFVNEEQAKLVKEKLSASGVMNIKILLCIFEKILEEERSVIGFSCVIECIALALSFFLKAHSDDKDAKEKLLTSIGLKIDGLEDDKEMIQMIQQTCGGAFSEGRKDVIELFNLEESFHIDKFASLFALLTLANGALRSYEAGNSSPDMAKRVADQIEEGLSNL